ncbi:MAG: hypothetical protein QGF09_09090 [Rhodospirillales bacterium]|jgi:2-keto-4-pentenoate hydratase/2-oxohepta-3-ene-1,7-dioic acid hydratase in catechol pathway|nr:hypothetical protein [Rhodospirillales bacterium]
MEKPYIWGFWNVTRDFLGARGDMIYPARCGQLDFEGEVGVILGAKGKDLSPGNLKDFAWA